ncbi:MAG: DUF4199 domain-containing protein, partial [Candidatus Didemnitutus sp.]|nr:DUF4199 domain-containing protein [Candidatus Didemnitutus sp.]
MGTKFTFALTLTVIQAVFSLLMYFTGYQTEKLATGQYIQWVGFALVFVVLWMGVKAVREENPHHAISYGQAVGAGFVISLLSGLMTSIYSFIHYKFINTNFADYQLEILRGKWAEAGLSDTQMEQAENMTRAMMGPTMTAVMTFVGMCIVGLIMALIIAAFLKRAAPADAEPAL